MFDTGKPDPAQGGRRDQAFADLAQVLDTDASAPGSAQSAALEAWHRLEKVLDGHIVGLIPAWDASGDWSVDGSATPTSWLRNHTGRTQPAAGGLRRTGLLAATMPAVAAAAATGTLPLTHIHALTRARTPDVAELFDRDQQMLVDAATTLTADSLRIYLARWHYAALEHLGRNETDKDPDPLGDRDHLSLTRTYGGRTIVRGELGPVAAATLIESIDAEIDARHRNGTLDQDHRTRTELQAAALQDIIARGARNNTSHRTARPLITAICDLDHLFDLAGTKDTDRTDRRCDILNGGPIATHTIQQLLCEADIALVITDNDAQPLYTGRTHRHATAAQHRALQVRSHGTCETPGCTNPHHWCHDHHITHWEHHGKTDINNLVMLCPQHHQAVHDNHIHITATPRGPTFHTPNGTPLHYPYQATG